MNSDINLQIQIAMFERLLKEVGDDPFLADQIRERLEDAESELAAIAQPSELFPPDLSLARTAIFLSGEKASGVEGIKPQLAGEALISYERMFVAQAMLDERATAIEQGRQRRRRGTSDPSLLFTGTLHGSFGLEFTTRATGESSSEVGSRVEVHAKSLRNVANTITRVVESKSGDFDEAIKTVRKEVLAPLKRFLGVLAKHGAEVRFAFPDQSSRVLSADIIKTASDRLESKIVEEKVKHNGMVRRVTWETLTFDFRLDDGSVISGDVSPDLGEDELERIHNLTNHRCIAEFDKITMNTVGGAPTTEYILLNVQPINGGSFREKWSSPKPPTDEPRRESPSR